MSEVIRESLPRDVRTGLTTGFLAWIAVNAKAVQTTATLNVLPYHSDLMINSLAHPVLGYAGASLGMFAKGMQLDCRPDIPSRLRMSAIGAVAVNFGFEIGQSLTIASERTQNFMSTQNAPETLKDFIFALGGMGIILFQERKIIWQRFRSRQSELAG